ncbi:aminoglycoside 3'-phosphotransferase [Microbacterium protaetiae]|uniref:Aminoglycoside 3'-phosphotransferase n=1 Tax=Microbacterium protaetiae TaxID=2509458 RepID=A0A4P6EAP7_9MICO|nr:aminoglycoside 3'-phosphotransferase [Microbacterium protaetiae]QAY59210.1 aminoglycoside 3'-phosphotransferase [Microbacterium protaetiae]
MSIPTEPVAVPDRVQRLARGAALTPVWINELGGITFRTNDARYIKWGPRHPELDVIAEAERLAWAAVYASVPRVLDAGRDAGEGWLVTAAIDGSSAVDPRWIAEPRAAVRAVGQGLRVLHDALPVDQCPFEWSVPSRLGDATGRGIHVPDHLRVPPPVDVLVVCHGDACCPNTLLDDAGEPVAHVDLGSLGVGDRWADIAVASMSTEWNYGPGWDDELIAAYGVEPDRERLAYYRALWNAT